MSVIKNNTYLTTKIAIKFQINPLQTIFLRKTRNFAPCTDKMRIHIFNPENDMALADGRRGYTAPANIRAYRKRNWRLPYKWAAPDDIVWDGETPFKDYGITDYSDIVICPWGWSKAIVHELEQAGVPRGLMPSDTRLTQLRTLSSRETTVAIQTELGLETYACHTIDEIESILAQEHTGRTYIMKSPWSSSGKGLMTTDNPNWHQWAKRTLRQQGCVTIERKMQRERDFAMEFALDGLGTCTYLGLSVFDTDPHGHYISNHTGPEDEKTRTLLSSHPDQAQTLTAIRRYYIERLPQMAPWYKGPVGVDMLLTPDGVINPCIEINWRMTMGLVAITKQ